MSRHITVLKVFFPPPNHLKVQKPFLACRQHKDRTLPELAHGSQSTDPDLERALYSQQKAPHSFIFPLTTVKTRHFSKCPRNVSDGGSPDF